MKFVLTIEVGNDAMRTGSDVAGALRAVASRLESSELSIGMFDGCAILDDNGNRVGSFEVTE